MILKIEEDNKNETQFDNLDEDESDLPPLKYNHEPTEEDFY